jgi:hypothetical protein
MPGQKEELFQVVMFQQLANVTFLLAADFLLRSTLENDNQCQSEGKMQGEYYCSIIFLM